MRLSKKSQWQDRWSKNSRVKLEFDPLQPSFCETHRILQKFLPQQNPGRFLEVGAYPGKYLWYFYKYFRYEPWGVEYVESCAKQAQEMLNQEQIPAKMIVDDFFDLEVEDHIDDEGWDLVASFGFVEHFDDPAVAVAKHLEMTKAGGLVVITVPNHAGWNGRIMHFVDREKWQQHNCMTLDDLINAFELGGNNKIVFSGYAGHIGFWNTCVYETVKNNWRKFYPLLRAPLWMAEHIGRWIIPNNMITSPEIIIIAKKGVS